MSEFTPKQLAEWLMEKDEWAEHSRFRDAAAILARIPAPGDELPDTLVRDVMEGAGTDRAGATFAIRATIAHLTGNADAAARGEGE